jgi:hypothetical protein
MWSQPLFELCDAGLDPAKIGRVVDCHAPIRQHLFEVAAADVPFGLVW